MELRWRFTLMLAYQEPLPYMQQHLFNLIFTIDKNIIPPEGRR